MKKIKNLIKKQELFLFFLFLFSEIIYLFLIKINLISYANDKIYSIGINIVQFLYFLPIFLCSSYCFFCQKPTRTSLVYCSVGLLIYAIILHHFIRQIAGFFTDIPGIINFVEYASKIYFICLPLVGFPIMAIKTEQNYNKIYFFIILKFFLLLGIILIFKRLFALKGILYAWPFNEFLCFIRISLQKKQVQLL